jgi:predicted nucleic acid-binding protein
VAAWDEGPVFVDTNILLYAIDIEAREKHRRARQVITSTVVLGCAGLRRAEGADAVLTEDLNAGQRIAGVTIVNPL